MKTLLLLVLLSVGLQAQSDELNIKPIPSTVAKDVHVTHASKYIVVGYQRIEDGINRYGIAEPYLQVTITHNTTLSAEEFTQLFAGRVIRQNKVASCTTLVLTCPMYSYLAGKQELAVKVCHAKLAPR